MSFNPQKFRKKHEKTLFTNRGRFDTTQQLKSTIGIVGLRHLNHALQVTSFNHKIKLKTYNYPAHASANKR